MRHFLAASTLVLAGCVAQPRLQPSTDLADLLGSWEFSGSEACASNPQVISFSPDGSLMHITWPQGGEAGEGDLRDRFTYRIGRQTGNAVRLDLVDETRMDALGNPVAWDLVRLDQDSFCWRRSDWGPASCTRAIVRCPG